MRRLLIATSVLACVASCFTAVDEVPIVPDAGGCPAGEDCGGGLLPDAGCPIGQVCPACDAGLVLVAGQCVEPGLDSGVDAGPTDAGLADAGRPDSGAPDGGLSPDGGQGICLSGSLNDAESMASVAGAIVSGLTLTGVPIAGLTTTSGSDGSFSLCPPVGATFTTQVTASGYPTTYFESVTLSQPLALGSLPMISSSLVSVLGGFLPGGIDAADGIILVPLRSLTGNCSVSGWSVAASYVDSAQADGGYQLVYLSAGGLPSTTVTSTSSEGAAVVYDIDPTLGSQIAVSASSPMAGSCAPVTTSVGFTGQVEIAPGALSVAPIVLP